MLSATSAGKPCGNCARTGATHWETAQSFAQRFPTIDVDADVL